MSTPIFYEFSLLEKLDSEPPKAAKNLRSLKARHKGEPKDLKINNYILGKTTIYIRDSPLPGTVPN